jgi:hypothetical protein
MTIFMKDMRTTIGISLTLLLGLNGFSQTIELGDAAHFSNSLSVGTSGKLTVKVNRGNVHVLGADQTTVEIQVDREVAHAGASEAARILKEEQVVVEQKGNDISITANPPSFGYNIWSGWRYSPNMNAHYKITLPRAFEVDLKTEGGGIEVAHIQGRVDVSTEGGGLDFNDVDGEINGRTEGGGISANACRNAMSLKTEGGSIVIKQFTGSRVQAVTEGGSVSADFATPPRADCELRTEGGSVSARIPGDAAIALDAGTEGGSVSTELPVQVLGKLHSSRLKGTINGGGPLLKLITEGGNVAVLKR